VPAKLKIATEAIPLANVEDSWNKAGGKARTVFIV
jgi:hypothetical protein